MQRTNPLGIPWLSIEDREHGCGRLPRRRSRIMATDTIGGCRRSGSFPFCSRPSLRVQANAGLGAKTFTADRQRNAIRRLNRYSCALCKSPMIRYPSREINCKDRVRPNWYCPKVSWSPYRAKYGPDFFGSSNDPAEFGQAALAQCSPVTPVVTLAIFASTGNALPQILN
jgi:hypothetical protein